MTLEDDNLDPSVYLNEVKNYITIHKNQTAVVLLSEHYVNEIDKRLGNISKSQLEVRHFLYRLYHNIKYPRLINSSFYENDTYGHFLSCNRHGELYTPPATVGVIASDARAITFVS